jgi:excisionase family DNA binding protein
MSRKLLTTEQLAKELSVGAETVEKWGRTGKIPRIQISRKIVRYDRNAVLSALAQVGERKNTRHSVFPAFRGRGGAA